MPAKVLIVGANFENQGAYLMLAAVSAEIRERLGAVPVLDNKLGTRQQKAALGIVPLLPGKLQKYAGFPGAVVLARLLPRPLRFLLPAEVSAVIDISGFRYGDQWAKLDLNKFAERLARWDRMGVPVYMLPQAFGPFEKTGEAAGIAFASARLIMPRDPDSARYVEKICEGLPHHGRIVPAGDFTGPLKGSIPDELSRLAGMVPVIPNWNIFERAVSSGESERYIENLVAIVRELRRLGYTPYGLSHEGERDVEILGKVRDSLGEFDIVSGQDGLALKGIIGGSRLVVSGRFHAISSALSQGVPVVMHGWSHKYRWMAADYGVQELVVDPLGSVGDQLEALNRVFSDDGLARTIQRHAAEIALGVDRMWETIELDMREASALASDS